MGYLDSQYLYDHIFDVMMRRLAWLTWDTDIYVGTNMSVDEAWKYSWKWWREFISSKAEDLSWSDSQGIIDEYLKKNNYKLVFIIDNIERTNKDNILFLFKLIHNVLNFNNTIYILCFDDIRLKAVFENNLSVDYKYIKKIILNFSKNTSKS